LKRACSGPIFLFSTFPTIDDEIPDRRDSSRTSARRAGAAGAKFNRNGSWHDMAQASEHVHVKYDWLRGRDMIDSAETFIDKAASRSSLSGSDYMVQCPGSAAVPTSGWLKTELTRFRASRKE
jgi:uncharacterized protein DUF5329